MMWVIPVIVTVLVLVVCLYALNAALAVTIRLGKIGARMVRRLRGAR